MSSFTTPLELEYIDGRRWKLTAAFTYAIGALGSGRFITVPAGFITDFASIPQPLWNVLPPTGPYGKAAVIHDYLYKGGVIHDVSPIRDRVVDRGEADGILKEAMNVLGVDRLTRWTIFAGVRLGGHWAWNADHRATI